MIIFYKNKKGKVITVYIVLDDKTKDIDFFHLNKEINYDKIHLLNDLLCFDYIFSKEYFLFKDGIVLGSVVPNINKSYLCHKSAKEYRDQSVIVFNDMDKNCNNCIHLKRLPIKSAMKGCCDYFDNSHIGYKNDHFIF